MVSALRRRLPLASRAEAEELLDSGELTPSEVRANLGDLARMNRLPGGVSASTKAIDRLADASSLELSVLDAGTGAGDMPLAFARRGWRTTAIDTNPEVLRVARRATSRTDRVEILEADARHLPFADDTFDLAHSSLLLHHLTPAEAVVVLTEMRRVARLGVIVNDLRRGLLPLAITAVSVVAFGSTHVTRTDGIASARRSYTLRELDELLAAAGLRPVWRSNRWMPRVVTAAVPR
ncbi:MAG TPA: methyltransferase domain-containing protein [Candidatus Limnocylindria bacterium]